MWLSQIACSQATQGWFDFGRLVICSAALRTHAHTHTHSCTHRNKTQTAQKKCVSVHPAAKATKSKQQPSHLPLDDPSKSPFCWQQKQNKTKQQQKQRGWCFFSSLSFLSLSFLSIFFFSFLVARFVSGLLLVWVSFVVPKQAAFVVVVVVFFFFLFFFFCLGLVVCGGMAKFRRCPFLCRSEKYWKTWVVLGTLKNGQITRETRTGVASASGGKMRICHCHSFLHKWEKPAPKQQQQTKPTLRVRAEQSARRSVSESESVSERTGAELVERSTRVSKLTRTHTRARTHTRTHTPRKKKVEFNEQLANTKQHK